MFRFLIPALLIAGPALAGDPLVERRLFPEPMQPWYAQRIITREVHLAHCPALKRTPAAVDAFKRLIGSYKHTVPDVEGIKEWIRNETAEQLLTRRPSYPTDWCESARRFYGPHGKNPNEVVERSGAPAVPKCWTKRTCLNSDDYSFSFY